MQPFRGESAMLQKEKAGKTDGRLIRVRRLDAACSKKLLLADYVYEADGKTYYKSVTFRAQKGSSTLLVWYPQHITVFYDKRHPRLSLWERKDQEEDLAYIFKNEKAR